jgi:hypothetical protein
MARIRTIKPEFWASEQIMECSRNARLLFIGLWNFCDDAGRAPWKPRQIKAQVFPGDDDVTSDDVLGWLRELSANGLIMRYVHDDAEFFAVTGWHHQRIDKPQKPKYPAPVCDHSTNNPRPLPPDRKGREGIGEEGSVADAREAEAPEPKPEPPAPAAPSQAALRWDGYAVWELWQERRTANGHATSPHPPSPAETATGQRWIDAGADRKLVAEAFDAVLAQQGREPPRSLRYFNGSVEDALAVKRDPLRVPEFLRRTPGLPPSEADIAATRLNTYRTTGVWLDDWGARPAPQAAEGAPA